MKKEHSPLELPPPDSLSLHGLRPTARWYGCIGGVALVVMAFIKPLVLWVDHARRVGLDSYVLLVPFISAYLIHLHRDRWHRKYASSPGWAGGFAVLGVAALVAFWQVRATGTPPGEGGNLGWMIFAFLCWIVAVGFFFLGRRWMASVAFPVAFLAFMIPLPEPVAAWLENASKLASADIASVFFDLSGTPNLRNGAYFQLPDITIEVATECSGIRSSLVLFITALLTAYLLLRGFWRRALLVVLVIPLGFIRNGFRIWTIGQLCVYWGPQMIHSLIHTRGGPVFFALSLLPLFLVVWWLRRGETPTRPVGVPQPD